MSDLGPFTLAARQIELDRAATAQIPALFDRKKVRLAPSPHTFFRGSAPLFHEILAARPDLAAGPAGDGWIVGDMHLENVGAYRNGADEVVFALNDFDDGTIGPLHLDVLRLSTSVLLAGRGFRAGAQSISLVEHVLGAYLDALGGGAAPAVPDVVRDLVQCVKDRVVHRDVSPQNVLVGVDGTARVIDFGVAKAIGKMHATRDGQLKGKLAYMSPEQVHGRDVTRISDVFSAAVVLWEALMAERLFDGKNPAELIMQVLSRSIPRRHDHARARPDRRVPFAWRRLAHLRDRRPRVGGGIVTRQRVRMAESVG